MKRHSTSILLILSFIFGAANPTVSSAKEIEESIRKHTTIGPGNTSWSRLNQEQLEFLKSNVQFLEFQGAKCKIVSSSRCKVVKSKNPAIEVGDSLEIRVTNQQKHSITSATFRASCSWCGFVITSIEIVAFVVAAPTMTPAWMLYTTYFIGSSTILGNL
jgi:hypothetical protein